MSGPHMDVSAAVRRRLFKLLELARRGEGGEKDNAQRMLEALFKRHGLTMEDLERPERKRYRFKCRDPIELKLLLQIAYRVLDRTDYTVWRQGSSAARLLDLTPMEFAEIQFLWDLYRRQWSKERDMLLSAFIQRHKLFGSPTDINTAKNEMDERELARQRRMMQSLEQVYEHKPLEHKK